MPSENEKYTFGKITDYNLSDSTQIDHLKEELNQFKNDCIEEEVNPLHEIFDEIISNTDTFYDNIFKVSGFYEKMDQKIGMLREFAKPLEQTKAFLSDCRKEYPLLEEKDYFSDSRVIIKQGEEEKMNDLLDFINGVIDDLTAKLEQCKALENKARKHRENVKQKREYDARVKRIDDREKEINEIISNTNNDNQSVIMSRRKSHYIESRNKYEDNNTETAVSKTLAELISHDFVMIKEEEILEKPNIHNRGIDLMVMDDTHTDFYSFDECKTVEQKNKIKNHEEKVKKESEEYSDDKLNEELFVYIKDCKYDRYYKIKMTRRDIIEKGLSELEIITVKESERQDKKRARESVRAEKKEARKLTLNGIKTAIERKFRSKER